MHNTKPWISLLLFMYPLANKPNQDAGNYHFMPSLSRETNQSPAIDACIWGVRIGWCANLPCRFCSHAVRGLLHGFKAFRHDASNVQGVTSIKYCTDGVLLRELNDDPLLSSYRRASLVLQADLPLRSIDLTQASLPPATAKPQKHV